MANLQILKISLLISAAKLILLPAYRSTDFEVHRNWLAVTSSLPLNQWYKDNTSQWTLDYPPLFAWFEKTLSLVARLFDPSMLVVNNLEYASWATVAFQRMSVIVTDLVLVYATWQYVQHFVRQRPKIVDSVSQPPQFVLLALVLLNAGLLIVDHIHFQYNGFLFGVLMLSIVRICQGQQVEGCVWFATLLNLKHIYLYVAPAYGVYLLRNYCFRTDKDGRVLFRSFSLLRFLLLGVAGISVCLLSFGPFIVLHQIPDVISRLFPFKRGLCHAYWAPNFWALYNVADKVLTVAGPKFGLVNAANVSKASMTAGLVQEYEHGVLPSIRPPHTLALTVVAIVPSLLYTWFYGTHTKHFIRCIVMCAYGAFMFGWHVHEKAILLMIIPLALLAVENRQDATHFLLLSTIGHFSLFPLIFTSAETVLKYSVFLCYTLFAFHSLGRLFSDHGHWYRLPLLNVVETLYIVGLLFVEVYGQAVHTFLGLDKQLPFLPLMLTSVYCAIGVTYVWLKAHWTMFKPR